MWQPIDLNDPGPAGFALAIAGVFLWLSLVAGWHVYLWCLGFTFKLLAILMGVCGSVTTFGLLVGGLALALEVWLGDDK